MIGFRFSVQPLLAIAPVEISEAEKRQIIQQLEEKGFIVSNPEEKSKGKYSFNHVTIQVCDFLEFVLIMSSGIHLQYY